MKKFSHILLSLLTAVVGMAKDIKTVVLTTNHEMHCESCEKKIKIKYEATEVKKEPAKKK